MRYLTVVINVTCHIIVFIFWIEFLCRFDCLLAYRRSSIRLHCSYFLLQPCLRVFVFVLCPVISNTCVLFFIRPLFYFDVNCCAYFFNPYSRQSTVWWYSFHFFKESSEGAYIHDNSEQFPRTTGSSWAPRPSWPTRKPRTERRTW